MNTRDVSIVVLLVICCVSWSLNAYAAAYDPNVEQAQQRLIALGYEPGPADGKIGNKTIEAIKKYQTDNELEATGEVDEATRKALKIMEFKIQCGGYECSVENGLTDEMVTQIKDHMAANEGVRRVSLANIGDNDLKKLAAVTVIKSLVVRTSDYLTDITPVSNLKALELFDLSNAPHVTDIAPLSGLANLKELWLRSLGEPISLAPLANALPNLENVYLGSLNESNDEPFDISALADKKNLKKLTVYFVKVKDLSPLEGLTELDDIYLEKALVEDLSPLASAKKLTRLLLLRLPATDLTPIGELTELTYLGFYGTQFTDISPLKSLKKLTYIGLNGIKATDMSPIGEMTELRHVLLDETRFTDYSPLTNCTEIEILQARSNENNFSDLDVIKSMPNLRTLYVDGNDKIQNWDALATATNLESLSAAETSFSDLSLLNNMPKLNHFDLDECALTNPEVLGTLPSLTRVSVQKTTGIEDISVFKTLWKLKELNIYYDKDKFPQEQIDALDQEIEKAKALGEVMREEFRFKNDVWPENDNENRFLQIADGKYIFEHKRDESSWYVWTDVPVDFSQDFSIETTFTRVHGEETSGVGVIWGFEDLNNRYQLSISSDGSFIYGNIVDDEWEAVFDWVDSAYLNQGYVANTLSVRRLGGRMQIFLNHRYVGETTFGEAFGQKIGFSVHGPTRIEIEELLVYGTKL